MLMRWRQSRPYWLTAALAAVVLIGALAIPDQFLVGRPGPSATPGPALSTVRPQISGTDSTLPPPANLKTTGLNSTLRANWTPASDSRVAWQLMSFWDGTTLVGEKVLAATASAADGNGLVPDRSYTVAVQSMTAAGALSTPATVAGSTDGQSAMANSVFFENFDGSAAGPLDPNYFDVRLREGSTTPEGVGDRARAFVSEHHFHTELISGEGDAAITIRPRGIFDFANRVGTFQFEVDMAAVQSIPGKWFEIHLSRHAPTDAQFFGLAADNNDTYPDDLSFSVSRPLNATNPDDVQSATIAIDSGGVQKTVVGRTNNFTPKNVRVPVVLKVSTTSAEMLINGVSAVRATGFTLPFTRGGWTITHRAFYAPRSPSFPAYLQVIHWQTVQFDGPDGSFSPARKTYLAPGCPGQKVALHFDCTVDANAPLSIDIPEAVGGIASARLLFNPFDAGGCDHGAYTVNAVVNGHSIAVPTQPATPAAQGEHCYDQNLASVDIPPGWLTQGGNVVKLARQADQVEIEVAFKSPRVIPHPAAVAAPLIGVTNDNLLTGNPAGASAVDLTTYLFVQDANAPIDFTVANRTGALTPWLSLVTPTSGTLRPIATGGSLVPITVRIDFSKATKAPGNVVPGILQVTGNVYIAVAYDRTSPTYEYAIKTTSPLMTAFDKAAIPDYHGAGRG
jgi:hypothetical protein